MPSRNVVGGAVNRPFSTIRQAHVAVQTSAAGAPIFRQPARVIFIVTVIDARYIGQPLGEAPAQLRARSEGRCSSRLRARTVDPTKESIRTAMASTLRRRSASAVIGRPKKSRS